MSGLSKTKRALFALAAVVIVLGVMEGALRIAGFRYQRTMSYMEFNFPEPHTLHKIFTPDQELLWKMRPGYRMGEGFPPLNRQGFRGADFEQRKGEGMFRVACLGDSVTFGGVEATFPELLEEHLEEGLGMPVEVMNFGVPGYSSFQGRKLAEEVLEKYRPDAVVVLFGWNDHWLAKGYSDHRQRTDPPAAGRLLETAGRSRVYQLISRAAAAFASDEERPLVLRVPPDNFKANISAICSLAESRGTKVVLATAPSAIETGKVPDYLVHNRFIKNEQDLKPLHGKYNRLVRELSNEKNIPLADLDLIFRRGDVTSLFDDPEQDIIHPNSKGYGIMAREIGKTILTNELYKNSERPLESDGRSP